MRVPEGPKVGNIAEWQTAVGDAMSTVAAVPVTGIEQCIADLRRMRDALIAEKNVDSAAIPSLVARAFSAEKREQGRVPRADRDGDIALGAQIGVEIRRLTDVLGGLKFLKLDANAPDADRLALIKGLPSALSPNAWVALAHLAKADPNADVRTAASAKVASSAKMHASRPDSARDWSNPMNPMSQFGPGPSFYRR